MPTKKRISTPGALVHSMVRGINGMEIFKDGLTWCDYLELFAKSIKNIIDMAIYSNNEKE